MSLSFKIQQTAHQHQPSSSFHPYQSKSNSDRTSTRRLATDFDDHSSDDQDDSSRAPRAIELITDFDSTREPTHQKDSNNNKLSIIPALPDRDFRAIHLARKNKKAKKALYKPDVSNSLGGPERRHQSVVEDAEGLDRMNSKAIVGGLKTPATVKLSSIDGLGPSGDHGLAAQNAPGTGVSTPLENVQVSDEPLSTDFGLAVIPETIEQRAVRELLSQANEDSEAQKPIDAIYMPTSDTPGEQEADSYSSDSGDETAQFRRDVSKRPDPSTLADYERVPVGQFGLALLKGMGWKEGTSTSKRGRAGLVEAYVPQARPSLLGIGAKPLVLDTEPSSANGTASKQKGPKPDKKYMPLLRKVIDQGGPNHSRSSVRSQSRSPPSRHSSTSSPRGSSDTDRYRHDDRPHSSSRHRRCDDELQRAENRPRHEDERSGSRRNAEDQAFDRNRHHRRHYFSEDEADGDGRPSDSKTSHRSHKYRDDQHHSHSSSIRHESRGHRKSEIRRHDRR